MCVLARVMPLVCVLVDVTSWLAYVMYRSEIPVLL